MKPAVPSTARNPALDFTKGVLVVLMILYHWFNYFVSVHGWYYTYLRFITPSFIFLAGFLVAHIYRGRYRIDDPRLHRRLVVRGGKLLALFTALNLAAGAVTTGPDAFVQNAYATFVSGNGSTATFFVLVPIGYVLILLSPLLFVSRFWKPFFPVTCAGLFLLILLLNARGLHSVNLELIAVGILGTVVGSIPMARIEALAARPRMIAAAYLAYLVALTLWNSVYPLQLLGVLLNLMIIYLIGTAPSVFPRLRSGVHLLGQYSLLSYIAQIAILVALFILMHRLQWDQAVVLPVTFFAVSGLTYLTIDLVDRGRRKSVLVDRLYRLVLA